MSQHRGCNTEFPVHGSEEAIAQQQRRCKHWRGSMKGDTCAAGVAFSALTDPTSAGSIFKRLPCFNPEIPCGSACYPTREEVLEKDKRIDAFLNRMATIRTAILSDLGEKRSGSGEIACPCCKTGTVRYSRASLNGHVHARCSTPDCANWME